MDIALTPDTYAPGISDDGLYVDIIPHSIPESGIKCPCFDRYYITRDKFAQHSKCKRHEMWMKQLNLEKKNYFKKCIELEQTVKQQRLLIAQLEKTQNATRVGNLIDL
jgi:vacuolar-type H+-ATPase subunit D/Vma8